MAFEKAKVIKAAEKFLSQGKINAAIKEYRQIIAHDPDDFTTLNMLGDLLARANEKGEAAECFLRIAEHYRDEEFRLKAIAMYRKIDKLKPRDPAIAKELAELYGAQGLIADARAQYLVVADAYTKTGESKQTLKVLHKIADLDPQNTEVRLKLAEGYLKEHMQAEAAKAFAEAAHRLLENGRAEKALDAFQKAYELRPSDRATLKGLVSAHTALKTADEAAELLEKNVAEAPDDEELASMLADAYLEAEDAVGAERAVGVLMGQDRTNHRRYIEVAQLYMRLGQEDEAARIIGIIIEPMLAGREETDLLEIVDQLLARSPEHVPSLRLLARINWWQRDMEKLRGTLERLAEAAEAAELVEDERYALTQLVRLAPDEKRYADRLQTLGGVLDEPTADSAFFGEPGSDVVTAFESFQIEETEATIHAEPAASDFEWNSVAVEEPSHSSVSFADLNEETTDVYSSSAPPMSEASFDIIATTETITEQRPGTQEAKQNPEAMMSQELESVDFYISQGYSDIAVDTLDLLEKQFGSHPEISSRRQKLSQAAQASRVVNVDFPTEVSEAEPAVVTFGDIEIQAEPLTAQQAQTSSVTPAAKGIDSGLAEIFEEFRIEAEGEGAASNEDYETHYNMATAYKEMDLVDEAIREFQVAAGLAGTTDKSRYFQCCNMLGHCFMQKGMPEAAVLWFNKGLNSPGCSAEEAKALKYELGSAYEQMNDIKKATAAFTEVYGLDVSYRDIAERLTNLQKKTTSHKRKKN
jgi:tetratricopeptide (TPR) repeat protein